MFSLMGNCMSWMKKKREPARKVTLAILGLDNAGKTVTAKSISGEKPEDIAPTVGFQDVNFKVGKVRITMFDLGGGKNIRDIWYSYLSEVHGLVYVVDSSEPHRLSESRHVLSNLVEDIRVEGKPLLLLANKQDVKGALDEIDVCEKLRVEDMVNAHKIPCKVETCSAIQGFGKKTDPAIKNGLKWLVDTIVKDWDALNARVEKDSEEQREKDKLDKERKREKARKLREDREDKEKEQRRRRGLPSESEEEDDVDLKNGDPFKTYSKSELEKKEAKEKERKRRLKKWDEEDVRGSGPASRRRYGSDSDDDNRPSLNRRKNRFADDELNKSGNKSSRSYRSDDDSSKKGGLAKLSFRRSMEDISTKRSPMLNRRNNRSRTPSPDLYTDRKNFNSLSGRKSRSRSPSPPSRFGGRDSLNRSGKLAPLRNQRGMSNDYDSDKEPWHRNKLRSSGGYKRFDDSDDERTPRGSRRKVSPRDRDNSDEENKFPKRLTGSKTRFKSGSRDSDDEDDTYRNRSARGSGRYGRKDDSDSDNNAPPRVSFTTADPLSSARSNKGRSPRSSSPPIPTLRNGRSSSPPVPALRNARSSSPPVPALRNARDSGYELGPLSRRNLAPLAPIEPSAPPAGKKKKKNRFGLRNKTAPSPHSDDSDHTSGSERTGYRAPPPGARTTPPGSRAGSFRASRSPRLAPMEEQENELDSHSSFSRKWGLDLPEPAERGHRSRGRFRPNVDSDDDLVT